MVGIMSRKTSAVTQVLKQGGRKRKLGPIIVDFEHGGMDSGAFEGCKVGIKHKFPQSQNGDPELQVVVKSQHLSYSNDADSVRKLPKNKSLKTWLLVRNKETSEVRLVETNVVTVGGDVTFPTTINPFLLNEERKIKELEVEAASVQSIMAEKDARWKHLVKEFGPQKGKRFVEQSERQKVDSDAKNEKLKLVLENVDASRIILPGKAAPKELTPPCNREAKLRSQVYDLNDIVSDQEIFLLEQAASELIETYNTATKVDQAVGAKIFSEILGDVIKDQLLLQYPNLPIIGYCIYVEAIFVFLNLSSNSLSKGPRRTLPTFVPTFVATNIFEKFIPDGVVSQEDRDRAFCYGLITLLLISDYSVEFKKLSSAINQRQYCVKKLILVTGATIVTDPLTRSTFVELKLPLSKFDFSKSPRKKNRQYIL